ncbi:MAG: tetratricopeptide repeat protein [Leptolyngbya sp. SIO1D8]|nr:tetratricopeptide repeat protein [Leptolyngbya sp. SIO1D8]
MSFAISDYDRAIDLNPDYAKAYFNRGNARSDLGNKEGAIVVSKQAVRIRSLP